MTWEMDLEEVIGMKRGSERTLVSLDALDAGEKVAGSDVGR